MNKIYKVIWSKVRNCYVAVSEIAKRNGKSCTSVNCGAKANRRHAGVAHSAAVGATLLAGVCSVLLPVRVALAAPVMPTLDVNGKSAAVTITSTSSAASATMDISSTQGNNVLKWIDFSIGKGGTVQFDPNNYLNYVTGHGRSEIDGILKQTKNNLGNRGSIYIVNPNGVLFGDNARVDVGSLYVSTRELGADQFSAFEEGGNPLTMGDLKGDVVNLGKLNADTITVEGNNITFKNIADVTKGGTLTDGDITGGTSHNDSSVLLTANSDGEIHIGSTDAISPGYSMSGTSNKYMYKLVHDASELQNMVNARNYMLANDIDAGGIDDFRPIYYTGRFDGLNYKIKNLTIKTMPSNDAGLFGKNSGIIENVGVIDTNIDITSQTSQHTSIGGIVGANYGTVRNVYHTGIVKSNYAFVGGIVGWNNSDAVIEKAYNTGDITGDAFVAGIAGFNSGIIKEVYNTGTVTAKGETYSASTTAYGGIRGVAGGIVGVNVRKSENSEPDPAISDAYNIGDVNGKGSVGGIVGLIGHEEDYLHYAGIKNAYNTGNLTKGTGDNDVSGGIIGFNNNDESSTTLTVTSSYYTQGGDNGYGELLTGETKLMEYDTFAGSSIPESDRWDISKTGDAGKIWRIYDGRTMPLLTAFLKTKDVIENKTYDGTGDAGSFYKEASKHVSTQEEGFDYVQDAGYIEPKELIVTFADISKTYDGTTADLVASRAGTLEGVIEADKDYVSVTASAVYDEKNAGNRTVNYSGVTLSGTQAENYSIADTATGAGTITPKTLSLVNVSKVYDGTAVVVNDNINITSTDVIAGDSDSITFDRSKVSGTYADKNAGEGKVVNYIANDGALIGAAAGNYIISTAGTGDITKADLTLTTENVTKTYDGTTAVTGGTLKVYSGTLFAEDSISGGTFVFEDENAGANKKVYVSNATVTDGNSGGNYNISYVDNTTSTIMKKTLTVGNIVKEYDGTDIATLTVDNLLGVVEGDKPNLSISGVTANYTGDKAADYETNGKTVYYSGLILGGDKKDNYSIAVSGTSTTGNSITKRVLTANSVSKVYDGTPDATLHLSDLVGTDGLPGVVERDESALVLETGDAYYGNENRYKDAGNYSVTFSDISLTGDKAHNYKIIDDLTSINVAGTITRKTLELVADRKVIRVNEEMPSFTGKVIGFIEGEGLSGDSLLFNLENPMTTPVVGSYSVIGTLNGNQSGNYGSNYTFQNAASNATAFTVKPELAVLPALDFRGASVNVTINKSVENELSIDSTKPYNTLKWIDFSIGENGTVRFDSNSYLNYVTGHGRSDIDGTLTGGGAIYLINPNGVLFGSTAQVDVGNLYVSSRTLDSTALNAFGTDGTNPLATSPDSSVTGNIINRGTLEAAGITVEGNNVSFKNYADVTATGSDKIHIRADGEVHIGFANSEVVTTVDDDEYKTVHEPDLTDGWDFKKTDNTTAVTPEKYMLVRNAYELQNMKNNLLGNYMLANDIDFKGENNEYLVKQFIPIGSLGGWTDYKEGMFKGKLDGLYHVIRDIYIDNTAITQNSNRLTDIGIIGSNAGIVENLGVINGNVNITNSGASAVGGIVGANKPGGIIRNVYFSGSVKGGRTGTGGVAGWQNTSGLIENAYATGTVTSSSSNPDSRIYGVVGVIGGSIKNAYFSGKVMNDNKNEFYTNSDTGGGTFQNNISTEDMMKVATFNNNDNTNKKNWDISADGSNTTWRIYEGKTMPLLTAFLKTKSLVTETEYNGDKHSFDSTLVTGDSQVKEYSAGEAYSAKEKINAGVYNEDKTFYSDSQQGYNIVDTKLVIQPKKLRLDNTKVYDGTTDVTVSAIGLKLSDIIDNDVVTLADGSVTGGLYADKNAGENKAVTYTIADSTLGGRNAANYILTVKGTGTITPKALTATFADITKVYDGTTNATAGVGTLSGVIAADEGKVNVSASAAYDEKNAGSRTVNYTGVTLGGTEAANYSIATTATGAGMITPKVLTATFADISKTYDGTTSATAGVGTLSGVETIDAGKVSVSASAAYDQRNAGSRIVNYSGVALSGDEAANYSIATTATGAGTITPKELTATFADISKTYDGTTSATAGAGTLAGVIAADEGKVSVSASAEYDQKNAGSRIVNYSGVALSGDEAANYSIATTATGAGTITPKALTATFADITKVYDGTTSATAGAGTLSGVETVDTGKVSVSASAAYDEKNAGRRTVNYTGVTLSGSEAANYSIATTATGAGTITPKELTATFADISKIYDGTTNAIPGAGTLTGVIAADEGKVNVSASAAYDEKNAGSRTVNYTGVTLSGAEAGNYSIATTATGNGTIGRKALELVADPASTEYGDYNPASFTGRVDGFVTGESVSNGDTLLFALSDPSASAVGSYGITGTINGSSSGDYGLNYTFTNAASNANAFTIYARPASVQDMVLSDIIPGIKGKSGADISVTALDNAMEQARDKRAEVGIEFAVAQTILSVDADKTLYLENQGMKQPPAMTPQEVAEQVHAQQGNGNGVAAQAGGNAGANENGAASNTGGAGAVNTAMDVVQQTDDAVGTEESKRKKGVA